VVVAVLASLSVPLRRLTGDRPAVSQSRVADTVVEGGDERIAGVMRLRLLAPANSLEVATTEGDVLWRVDRLEAGEHERNVAFRADGGVLEVFVGVEFDEPEADTALFLTVLPDGVEEMTRYAIGAGRIDDLLVYEWNPHPGGGDGW